MPIVHLIPATKSRKERNRRHDEVDAVMDDDGGVTTESISGGGGHADGNNDTDDEYFRIEQRWMRSSRPSFSSSSSSSSSSFFGRLFPFHRAMEEARRVVFHPARTPPRVDEFDWKVEFQPAKCSGSKRSNDEASAPSEPMIMTPRRRNDRGNESRSSGGGGLLEYSSMLKNMTPTSPKKGRIVTAEKGPGGRRSDDCLINPFESTSGPPLEYSRPAKRCKVEGGTGTKHLGTLSGLAGILRPSDSKSTGEDDHFSSPITTGYNGWSLDRTSGSARQQESSRQKNKRLRFIDSRMRLVRRLKVGNLVNFGSDDCGGRGQNRNDNVEFGGGGSDQDDGFEYDVAEFNAGDDEAHAVSAVASKGSGFFHRFGARQTMAEF
jgi:hypothetical protein